MSAIVGERDKLLQAAGTRNLTPRLGKDLSLTVDASAFHVAVDGAPTPSFATFTAHKIDLAGVDNWVASNGATLSGDGLTRRLDFASMPGATTTVTLTTVEDGQIYTAKASISKVRDGAPGSDADVTPENLLTALEGRITKSQLFADLKSEINLITDPVSVPGSVQAQVKAETDGRIAAIQAEIDARTLAVGGETSARINAIAQEAATRSAAIGKEVDDRIAAVLAEAGARTTFVQSYTYSKQETNQALSIQASQIAAAYTTYTDQATGQALSTAAADVRNYSYSKAQSDSSVAAAETRLRAEFASSSGASEAYVQNWSYSKAQSDSAEATQSATLTTSFQGFAEQKKAEAITASAADVRNYAYSKSASDAAEAAQSSTLTTGYTGYADAARVAAVNTASADVRNYTYSKSTVDSAISSAESRLRAEFVGSGGATEAFVTNYAYSRAYIDGAEAAQTSALTTGYQGYADQKKSEAIAAAAADVRNYTFSKSDINAAEAAQSNTLTANYTAYANAARDQAVSAASADVRNYSYAKSATDSAISASESRLRAEFVSSGGATEAYVQGYAYSKAQIDASEAFQSNQLHSQIITQSGAQAGALNSDPYILDPSSWSYPAVIGIAQSGPVCTNYFYDLTAGDAQVITKQAFPIDPSRLYNLSALLYSDPGNTRAMYVLIDLYDSAGAQVATQWGGAFSGYSFGGLTPAGLWTRQGANIGAGADRLIPASARTCKIGVWFQYTGSGSGTVGQAAQDIRLVDITDTEAAKIAAITIAAADVRQYTYTKTTIDSAFASQSNQITAAYTSYADAGKAQAIAAAAADIRNYSYSKATVDGAIAQSTSSLTSTVAGHTATLQSQSTSINGLSTQYTLKSDINGYITGFGLASSANNGNPTSAFIINAGAFAVVAPGAAPKTMFTVGLVNGVAQMVLRGDAMVDGGVTARTLRIGSFDNIFPDPLFYDLPWWNRVGSNVGRFNFPNNGWKNSCSLYLPADGQHYDTETGNFPIEAGATYRIEMQVSLSDSFSGWITACIVISGVEYLFVGAPIRGNWSFNEPIPYQFDAGAPKGLQNFSMTYTAPNNGTVTVGRFRLRHVINAGTAEVGGISITRMSDNTLIKDGAILTKHLELYTGGHINLGTTGYNAGNGIWIEGVGGGHGARMFLGDSSSKKFLCDPANNVLGLYGVDLASPTINAPVVNGIAAVTLPDIISGGGGTSRILGSRTASANGARGSIRYNWELDGDVGAAGARGIRISGGANTATATFAAQVPTNPDSVFANARCTMTDDNGLTAIVEFAITADFY